MLYGFPQNLVDGCDMETDIYDRVQFAADPDKKTDLVNLNVVLLGSCKTGSPQ